MTKKNTYLLGILLTIIVGCICFYNFCSECNKETEAVVNDSIRVPATDLNGTSFPFAFNDGSYSYESNENFNFNLSSNSFLEPLSEKVNLSVSELSSFLSNNKGKSINITGYYKSDEANTSAFPNLGLARANAVKSHLVSKGIPASQINIFGKLSDELLVKENVCLGPISFEVTTRAKDDNNEELKVLYEKIKADPLVLYFNTGEANINLTKEEKQKVADISKYLDKVEGSVCNIVGHTDNTGSKSENIELGMVRARFAKSYFVKNGITESKISVSSEGPDSPIADNNTKEGKAKNRRTVVTLK